VSRGSGLDLGFEKFYNIDEDKSLLRAVGLRRALQFAVNVRSLGGGFTLDRLEHPTDWLMLSLARQRLIKPPDDRPTFLYLHTKGCHSVRGDFRPPPAWKGSVSSGETVEDRYDDLLAWVDHLWPLLEDVVDDDAVVVVTSDHGELLGEGGLFGHDHDHNLLYDVPLWVRGVDATWPGDTVSHIDVMREILHEVGAPSDPCSVSRSDADEVSGATEEQLEALGYR
jgi:arylsulfatase A-like enzyme